jgi:dolichol-phosphate mannosyltransferase
MNATVQTPAKAARLIDDRTEAPSAAKLLSVIVPCHNEADALANLKTAIEGLRSALAGSFELELLLVDDGSTDETAALMCKYFEDEPRVRILRHEPRRGIAAAIATGLQQARTEIVASLDADCTYDPLELVSMLRLLSDDVDLIVASPYHPQGGVENVPAWRLSLSRSASRLYRLVLRNKLHTYTSCVRVYRRSSVVDLPVKNSGFVGVIELVWQLDRRGGKIVEHPAVLKSRVFGQSKMRVARTALAHLRLLSRAAWLRLCFVRPTPIRRSQQAAHDPSKSLVT